MNLANKSKIFICAKISVRSTKEAEGTDHRAVSTRMSRLHQGITEKQLLTVLYFYTAYQPKQPHFHNALFPG